LFQNKILTSPIPIDASASVVSNALYYAAIQLQDRECTYFTVSRKAFGTQRIDYTILFENDRVTPHTALLAYSYDLSGAF
jgi:hypothetical protein